MDADTTKRQVTVENTASLAYQGNYEVTFPKPQS